MMGWYPGGWAGAGFWGMGVMVLVWGAVIAVAVWALARATRTEQVVGAPVESARALLDRRFAAGEIDAEEYAARRRALEWSSTAYGPRA
jgi:putative membrane protein